MTFNLEEVSLNPAGNEHLGVPDVTFSLENAHEMTLPFTMEELEYASGTLSLGKAEGLDGITNEMLQNTGPTAREMLLDLFNNVLTGGSLPSDWKIGDIVLILKKPPRTDINNYRPITLISSVSKLLTKIVHRVR